MPKFESSIPLDVFNALTFVDRLSLFNDVLRSAARIERFIDLDTLRALVMWRDPNGNYDHAMRADYCAVIQAWRESQS